MRERFEGRGGLRVKGEGEGEGEREREGEGGEVHLRKYYSDLVCYINQISSQ